MPEYLAPGVYVEETSFRSKSIEGVSTSTTAFVGPTSRGPYFDADPRRRGVDAIPEVLTSFADFERIYGGLDDLSFSARRTNYVAHAVRNYFENGGARLYVSRVFRPNGRDGRARSVPLVDRAAPADDAVFIARNPGTAGDGGIMLRQVDAPATGRSIASAPDGTMLRLPAEASPARLIGGNASSIRLPNGGQMVLTVKPLGAPQKQVTIEVKGERATVTGTALADQVDVQAPDNVLDVTVDGVQQQITLAPGQKTPAEIFRAINAELRSGRVQLTDDDELEISSDRQGRLAEVRVRPNPTLGFVPAQDQSEVKSLGTDNPDDNTVGDVYNVTANEINTLLRTASGEEIGAAFDHARQQIIISTADAGDGVTLSLVDDANDANDALAMALGLDLEASDTGTGRGSTGYYVKQGNTWLDEMGGQLDLAKLPTDRDAVVGDFLTIAMAAMDRNGNQVTYEDLAFDPVHPRWIGHALAEQPTSRGQALESLYAIHWGGQTLTAFQLHKSLFATTPTPAMMVVGGEDGIEPDTDAYRTALEALEQIDDISIVAAPGSSALEDARGITGVLVSHAERRRSYRVAVLDTPPRQTIGEARAWKAAIDSKYAALYYPWVMVPNPLARPGADNIPRELPLPPSGFVCGVYARNDIERGVHKAPANEIVRGALRFESDVNFAQQEVLNPLGVNCLRFFPGRGYRVWGARTASSDPEWKYVNVRRYFNYLERSIDVGTQWAVFESNGERLWANIRSTIENFLYNEWVSGALLGANPKEAFFVRCDRTTMTQYNIDNGQLVCLVGVAAIKPAEFVIFRIGQKTAGERT